MTPLVLAWTLLADAGSPRGPVVAPTHPGSLEQLSASWSRSASLFPTPWLLVGVGAVLAVTALAAWLRWRKGRGERTVGAEVWRRLAAHAGLSFRQRRLLARVARSRRLPSPLTLMVCATTFDHHAREYLAFFDADRGRDLDDRLGDIRDRLFAPPPRGAARPRPADRAAA